ncbi:MAG: methyl-accepting chemotaxis protein [Gammaproteobacteria bacterium]
MKVNMPVTDREVLMKDGTILVTRTNLKGIITYANDAFVEISGFSYDELVGKNHNVVRHPDMPPAAFEDLWSTIKQGRPWTAPVKNRTKSGDFYWVEANVTPVYKNGKIHEFLSVRYAPSREQVHQAEILYQKLNAKQASMRPKGLALMLKSIREMAIWKKTALALTAFLLPNAYLLVQLLASQNYALLIPAALLTVLAMWLIVSLVRTFSKTLEESINICYRLSDERFRNVIELDRNDQIGDFKRALYSMQVKLNADLARSKQVGAEATRIRQALDNVQSCVMVANNNLDIIYMNNTVHSMFRNAEADIRKQLPFFDASKLLGANIDQFHKNPAHQRSLLAKLETTLRSSLQIGGRYMNIVANPVLDDDGERIGIVVEWLDRTHEVKIEQEIETIVGSVKAGELSKRLELTDKEGFFKILSQGINELGDTIEKVMNEVAHVMSGVAEGDLTRAVTEDYQGLYGKCKDDINTSLEKLSEVFSQIRVASDFIRNTSQEIASGNNNLSQRVETQASSLQETASSMEELTGTVKNNADNAQQANQLANTARLLAEKGGNVVASAVAAMAEINDSSNKIAEIIGVIDEIAFQTNLLALNASVEAARAGEQGRGFSVVATEVRNLAQRSAVAAKESKELIQNSVQKVRTGTEFVNETGVALNEIVTSVKQVGDIVAEIAAASVEQSQGIEQVNQAVAQMDEITQQNAALAEQASAASVSMSDQANNMAGLLSFFRVKQNSEVQTVASASVPTSPAPAAAPPRPPKTKAAPKPAAVNSAVDDEWEDF